MFLFLQYYKINGDILEIVRSNFLNTSIIVIFICTCKRKLRYRAAAFVFRAFIRRKEQRNKTPPIKQANHGNSKNLMISPFCIRIYCSVGTYDDLRLRATPKTTTARGTDVKTKKEKPYQFCLNFFARPELLYCGAVRQYIRRVKKKKTQESCFVE